MLQTLISAARLMIEAVSGNMLIDQTWRIVLDTWPANFRLRLPIGPLRNVVSVRVFASDGQPQLFPTSALTPETGTEPSVLVISQTVPAPGRASQGIEIDVLIGHGLLPANVPAPLRQAVLRLVANWFENRGDVMGGSATSLPKDIMALIAPYRRVRL